MTLTQIWALRYLKQGFSIIPLKPRSKIPLIKWAEFQNRCATIQQTADWFTEWPNAGIGIVTGPISNLVVLDADGPRGLSYLKEKHLNSPLTAISGNGKHLYFKWHEGIKNSESKIAPSIDIRGEGGFVVAPPSLHENGKKYRWLNLFVPQAMILFPVQILSGALNTGWAAIPDIQKSESWISKALEEMKNGHVHNTLVSVLGKFRYHNFSVTDTIKLLRPYAFNEDGTPFAELDAKVEEIFNRYPATQVVNSDARSIETFLENEVKIEWVCRPFFAKQTLNFIVGLPESLKSWLTTDLAIEIARGGKWLGQFETKQSKVLYIDQERALPETQRRFKSLLSDKGISRKELSGQLFVDCSSHRKMDLDTSYESFRTEVNKIRPDIIIVDSFVTFHNKPENDRMEIQKVLDRLKKIREEFCCSFVFINHESKAAYQDQVEHSEPSAGRMVGSIGVVAAAESILTVKKITANTSSVYHTKNSLAQVNKDFSVNVVDTVKGIEIKAVL